MIDNHFRKVMPRYVEPLVVQLSKVGIRPNHITIFAFIVSASAGYFVVSGQFILAAIIWWVGRFFDGLDGILARATQSTSEFGAYLDILLDMAAYSLFVVALSFKFPELNINWNIILFLYVLCILLHCGCTCAINCESVRRQYNSTLGKNRHYKMNPWREILTFSAV